MAKELRIFGPPGCGKTTRLATEEIPNAAKKYGPDRVVITSFTRAGAQEIASKKSRITGDTIPIESEHVGTLHALCHREMGRPGLIEIHTKEWNDEYPDYKITGKNASVLDDGMADDNTESTLLGDSLLNRMNILRASLIDKNRWPLDVQRFDKIWTDYKNKNQLFDFTDLIEQSIKNMPYAPGRPDVIFVDEAQDFTALQLKLVRSWGTSARWVVLVGDDDQTLYRFTGATPDAFLNPPIDDKFKRKLSQSYRVPQAVLELSQNFIKNVSVREEKEYRPRMDEITGEIAIGKVSHSSQTFKTCYNEVRDLKDYISTGKTAMFLTTCSYMLSPIIKELKEKGLPFHNPYRMRRTGWNPLAKGSSKKTMPTDLLLSFYDCGEDENYWDIRQLLTWCQYLRVGDEALIKKQGNVGIKALKAALTDPDQDPDALLTSRNVLHQILTPAAIEQAMNRNFDWLAGNLKSDKAKKLEYPQEVIKSVGLSGLAEKPQITVGTIHSVKGGEADRVYLFPDIPKSAWKEIVDGSPESKRDAEDSMYRLFYVGMTRAREELIIMDPAKGGYYFRL